MEGNASDDSRRGAGLKAAVPYAALAVSLVALLMLACVILGAAAGPGPGATPTPTPAPTGEPGPHATPVHSLGEAKKYVARVMASYSDMIYAEVPTPAFNPADGQWEAVVTMYRNNVTQRAFLKINDSPALLLDKAYLEGPKPPLISENWVVANGTLRIAGKIACTPDAGCGNETCVWEFADPYDRFSIAAEDRMDAFVAAHNDTVSFTYRVLLAQSLILENSYGRVDVERISYYFVCAQEQGLLAPLKRCALGRYREKGVDAPLSEAELDACLPEGLDSGAFGSCVETAYARIASDKTLAETYLGVNSLTTPSVVFGCQYRVHPSYLEVGFCAVSPDAHCQAD
ncbi:MAG: hypothetical protein PHF51_02715 [Candidatus ainarchaeum sp.]|nr:hypothetical protein [Candidatus ainarchaeum sp.]